MNSYDNLFAKTNRHGYIGLSLDHNRKPRQFILLETSAARRYAGFIMMKRDLDRVLDAIKRLFEITNPIIIQQSLFFFAIVTYAKCFTSNQAKRPSLDAKDIFKKADVVLKKEHDHIIGLRNGYVAHAGDELDRCAVVATVVDIGIGVGFDVNCQLSQPINMTPKLGDFQALCEFVIQALEVKIDRSFKQVMDYVVQIEEEEFNEIVITPNEAELYKLVASDQQNSGSDNSMVFVKV